MLLISPYCIISVSEILLHKDMAAAANAGEVKQEAASPDAHFRAVYSEMEKMINSPSRMPRATVNGMCL